MSRNVRAIIDKLDQACRSALELAAERCGQQTHYNVEVEHVLAQLQTQPELLRILSRFQVAPRQLADELARTIERFDRGNARTPALAPQILPWIEQAWLVASIERSEQQVGVGALLLALLRAEGWRASLLAGVPALAAIDPERLQRELDQDAAAPGAGAADGVNVASAAGAVQPARPPTVSMALPAGGALARYTVDLTALARAGAIDPIGGREAEVRQIVDILMRRRQNNPILTGEPGVGKTAIVEGFAARVAAGDVPPALAGVAVLSLDLGLLQAGAGVKGEFENRLKAVIAEVRGAPTPVILFIDEAHQLIGAGGAEGQGDAANLLKPALARGELRTIAATTWGEYKKYIEKDGALARRFQVVKVEEPDEECAIAMLRGVAGHLERHHGVDILDAAVRDAVRLSHRYISGRKLPDKAISVLDTACARVAIGQSSQPPELEGGLREIARIESELRVLGYEALAGADYAARIAELDTRLAALRADVARLLPRLDEERLAVAAIVALRRRLRLALGRGAGQDARNKDGNEGKDEKDDEDEDGNKDEGDDEDVTSVAHLSRELARLEQGLVAIQEDQPLVPVCVDARMVAGVVASWTGIPVGKMLSDEIHTIVHLKDRLAERVIGQDAALDTIARRIRTFRAELDDPGKPVGVFLLAGPSGVGKTETAAALAELLYGGERNMIVVNMSEFQEAHTVSNIKGAPPGYVGFGQGGVLTEAVRRKPYSVVLLDEVEKAHADVMELFYQVFDKGTMEDSQGLAVDFRNTVILLTSNAGQDALCAACRAVAAPSQAELEAALRPALLACFRPAFLGRLVVVPYRPLGDEQIAAIVKLKLEKIRRRFEQHHHAALLFDPALTRLLARRCTETDSGARAIDNVLSQSLLPELSALVLERVALGRPYRSVRIGIGADGAFIFGFGEQAA